MTGDESPGRPDGEETAQGGQDTPRRTLSAAERARLDRIFGDVLHERTGDGQPAGGRRESDSDAFLRANIPPHHG